MPYLTLPAPLQETYEQWCVFLDKEVSFALQDSDAHTKDHCARVLGFALMIAQQMGLSAQDCNALALASVFHDARRHDDMFDVGHGLRGADYYREYCQEHDWECDLRAYFIMAFHDHDDVLGQAALQALPQGPLLYQSFKDADALDRFRLGPFDLDRGYLRTEAARGLYEYARSLWADYWPIKF